MDIEFCTTSRAKLCNSEKAIVRKFGQPAGQKLMQRLGELAAANNLGEIERLPPAGLHLLKADRAGQWAVTIHGGQRLVFEPLPEPVPKKPDGGLDLTRVTGVRVVFIGDYH